MHQKQNPPPLPDNETVEWFGLNGGTSGTLILRAGMEVAAHLRTYYGERRDRFEAIIAEAARCGVTLRDYYLVDRSRNVVGSGSFNVGAGPDEMAFVTCLFHDLLDCTIAFAKPEGFNATNVKDAETLRVKAGNA